MQSNRHWYYTVYLNPNLSLFMILNMKVPNFNMLHQSSKDSIVYYSKYHLLTIFQIFIIYDVFKLISSTSKIYKGITLFAIGISFGLFEKIIA